jgi:5-aminolevulinate synthase
MGGDIVASTALCDFIRSFASGFIFTTALPPALAAGALASIQHLKVSQQERFAHQQRVRRLRALLDKTAFATCRTRATSRLSVGDAAKCKWISDILLDNFGLCVQPINYPTVPKKTERLRVTPTPLHSDADIDHLVGALHSLWSRCALARAAA